MENENIKAINGEYSLMPFHKNRCIFVHIPKCAGLSVAKSLFGNKAGGHNTLKDYRKLFEPADFESYFKFCFVRNPWDRLVSAFHFLKNGGISVMDRQWSQENLTKFKDFRTFVNEWVSISKNKWSYIHFLPQYYFIFDNEKESSMDFIGDYESLKSDYTFVAKRLGIVSKLSHINSSSRKRDFRNYYDSNMIDIVGSMYKTDIELFEYEFE